MIPLETARPKGPLGAPSAGVVSNGMIILVDLRPLVSGAITGVEKYTVSLLAQLLRTDAKNRYLFFFNRFRKRPLPREWDFLMSEPTINWHIPNKLLDACERFLGEPKVDRFVRADLVWSPHFNILRTTARAKRVITIHDLSPVSHPRFFPPRKRLWHWMQDVKGQARRATRLIAVSEYVRRDIIETFGVPPERVVAVHSGVDPFFRLDPGEAKLKTFRAMHGLAKPFVLFVGTLEPRKNVLGLIEAFDLLKRDLRHRDLKLVLVGRRGWLYDGVERALARSPYRSDIRLWGPATTEEIRFLYHLATLFAYPSFFEGFGFPVLEAQTCGAPVVASNTSSLPEILGESALLVDPEDTAALAGAMQRVLGNDAVRSELRARGFENAGRFTWERAAAATLSTFEEARAA
jgi:glycosyltransferase involved in cell wall biosynthesis